MLTPFAVFVELRLRLGHAVQRRLLFLPQAPQCQGRAQHEVELLGRDRLEGKGGTEDSNQRSLWSEHDFLATLPLC